MPKEGAANMASQRSPWLIVKILAVVHLLLPLGAGTWLLVIGMRWSRTSAASAGGFGDLLTVLLLTSGAVLLVASAAYLVAMIGVILEQRWAAMMLFLLATLQAGLELMTMLRIVYAV